MGECFFFETLISVHVDLFEYSGIIIYRVTVNLCNHFYIGGTIVFIFLLHVNFFLLTPFKKELLSPTKRAV